MLILKILFASLVAFLRCHAGEEVTGDKGQVISENEKVIGDLKNKIAEQEKIIDGLKFAQANPSFGGRDLPATA